jgi:hypothetical protein
VEASNRKGWDEEPRGRGVRECREAQGEEVSGKELSVRPTRQNVVLSGASAHMHTMEASFVELIASSRSTAGPGQRRSPVALVLPVKGIAEQGEEGSSIGMMPGAVAGRQVHDNIIV